MALTSAAAAAVALPVVGWGASVMLGSIGVGLTAFTAAHMATHRRESARRRAQFLEERTPRFQRLEP